MAIDIKKPTAIRELVVPVTGMTCASCVRHVEKALKRVEGVSAVAVKIEPAVVYRNVRRVEGG